MPNNLVPNSFQCPNFLIDRLDYYLTPSETKVLVKAVREILGWNEKIPLRRSPIGLSIFVKGKPQKEVLGCGLGLGAVRDALENLDRFHILVKIGQPTQDGQMYWLQDDETKIDWDALQARRDKLDKKNKDRTEKATQKSLQSRGVTSDVRGNVGRNTPITSDVTQGVTSVVNKETQGNPDETQNLSIRDEAGKMSTETELAMLTEWGRQGNEGVADPSQDDAQWMLYGDEAVNVFVENGGDLGRKVNQQRPRIEAIKGFVASCEEFDMDRWRDSVHTAVIIGGVNGDNLACLFDTYNSGGNYQAMFENRKKAGNNGKNRRHNSGSRVSSQGPEEATSLGPKAA